jgi:hypothetical protein
MSDLRVIQFRPFLAEYACHIAGSRPKRGVLRPLAGGRDTGYHARYGGAWV